MAARLITVSTSVNNEMWVKLSAQARRINQQYDLSTIVIGLLDEIFQAHDPVLV